MITPQRRALLNTISFAEGTWDSKANRPRYDITFGYQKFDPSKPHPDRVVRSGGYASAASGAYQFMPDTWAGTHGGVNKPMTPQNQDVAAIRLVQGRGALGLFDKEGLSPGVVNKLAPEWASFPTLKGGSFYGQPNKSYASLKAFYDNQLAAINKGGGVQSTPGVAPDGPVAAVAPQPQMATGGGASAPVPLTEDAFTQRLGEALAAGSRNPFEAAFGFAPTRRMAGARLAEYIDPIAPAA
jgi:muramidase (phage lysozyme)